MSYRYILFDMDGVLVDSERVSFEIWKDYFARDGIDLPLDMYILMCGRSNEDIPPIIRENYPAADSDGLPKYWEAAFGRLVGAGLLPVKKGAAALFDAMDEKGTRRAVASSNAL